MSEHSVGPSLHETQADQLISAEKAVEIFRARKTDMTEGIRRNLYWPVRDFASGYMDNAMRKSITDASKMSYAAHDYTEQMRRIPNASQVRVFFGDRTLLVSLAK